MARLASGDRCQDPNRVPLYRYHIGNGKLQKFGVQNVPGLGTMLISLDMVLPKVMTAPHTILKQQPTG
jgi:hypothetical protein